MIIINLPFPPLPVVVLRGDGEYGMASGHDLLSQAVSVELVAPVHIDGRDLQTRVRQKQRCLEELYATVNAIVATSRTAAEPHDLAHTEELYAAFCGYFRTYMSCYPGSADLRFYPLAHVSPTDVVMDQARDHVKAMNIASVAVDTHVEVTRKTSHLGCYTDVLWWYAEHLFEERGEELAGI